MSQNKDKSVTVEDETSSSTNSDVEQTYKKVGIKQDLVNRLVSEAKKRCELGSLDNSEKAKGAELSRMFEPALNNKNSKFNFETFLDRFGNIPSDDTVDTSLDKAILSGEVEYVYMARQVALERAYIVRVADEDGWSVAANWQQYNLGQLAFPCPTSLKEHRTGLNSQESFDAYFLGYQALQYVLPQNSWSNAYEQQQSFHYLLASSYKNFGSASRFRASKEVICYLCEGKNHYANEIIQNQGEVDHTWEESILENKVEVLNKEQLVMGRLHSKSAVRYWKEVIKPVPIVIEWLKRKFSLFLKENFGPGGLGIKNGNSETVRILLENYYACQGIWCAYSDYCTSLDDSSVVVHDYRDSKRGNRSATIQGNYSTGPLRMYRTLQQQKMVVESNSNRLVQGYLVRTGYLIENSISKPYRKRLVKVWKAFVEFAIQLAKCLALISRAYKA
ncbi:6175_t:CDS:2 [Gigaspora margarita]|uniref:6175_t:CDS:1 n=1 Tax=Gigaspora margarita TaxID=4874 RepID=A0ABN7VKW5_GIGMA|nr:6175_t:CDS:2 [Gigaspora margarita]